MCTGDCPGSSQPAPLHRGYNHLTLCYYHPFWQPTPQNINFPLILHTQPHLLQSFPSAITTMTNGFLLVLFLIYFTFFFCSLFLWLTMQGKDSFHSFFFRFAPSMTLLCCAEMSLNPQSDICYRLIFYWKEREKDNWKGGKGLFGDQLVVWALLKSICTSFPL